MLNPANQEKSSADSARAALASRLAQLDRNAIPTRPPKSLQPTPEAAKTRVRRLRKKRLLLQRSKRIVPSPEQPRQAAVF
jgi:hypothetical protein